MRRLCVAVCALALLAPAAARADDEALRKQVAKLEAENGALKDEVIKLQKELAAEKAKAKPAAAPLKPAVATLSDTLTAGTIDRKSVV